jgi:hypothetical protein
VTAEVKPIGIDKSGAETEDSAWKGMYRIGGAAALIATGLFLIDMIVLIALRPYPDTANGWFTLLQNNRFAGLLSLDILVVAGLALWFPLGFALYGALKRVNGAYAALAVGLAFAGVAICVATDKTYSIIYLSDKYAAATTDAQRSLLLAAGESAIALANGTGAGANLGGLLAEGAALLFSMIMLRGSVFGRATAYMGIVGHGLDVARIITDLVFVPIGYLAFASGIGSLFLAIGGTLQLIWYILVARRLLQLGRNISTEGAKRN